MIARDKWEALLASMTPESTGRFVRNLLKISSPRGALSPEAESSQLNMQKKKNYLDVEN